jgi:hypothetical protein
VSFKSPGNLQSPGNSLNAPNFGIITEQENNPRVLQVALRLEF